MLGAMSEIPVGSPPIPPGRHAAPLGWYPDPLDGTRERYWDGWQWSRSTRQAAGSPPAPTGGQPAQPWSPASTPWATPTTTDGVPLAGWGQRLGAGLLDWVFLSVVSNLIVFVVQGVTGADVRMQAALNAWTAYVMERLATGQPIDPAYALSILLTGDFFVQLALSFGIGVLYYAGFHGALSATPGKLMLGLRVVPEGRGQQTQGLDWGRSIVRAVVWRLLMQFALLLLLVDALWPLWNDKKQALHDKLVRTQVVRVRPPTS